MGDTGIVLGSLGYFIIFAFLLGLGGFSGVSVSVPTAPGSQTDANGNLIGSRQGFVSAVAECIITIFSDCSTRTETKFYQTVTSVIDFTLGAVTFLFQLLTFQIPEIPAWLNAIAVLPPAAVLAFVGYKAIRGYGT